MKCFAYLLLLSFSLVDRSCQEPLRLYGSPSIWFPYNDPGFNEEDPLLLQVPSGAVNANPYSRQFLLDLLFGGNAGNFFSFNNFPFGNGLFGPVTTFVTRIRTVTSTVKCVSSSNFLNAAAASSLCRRRKREDASSIDSIAPSNVEKVETTDQPAVAESFKRSAEDDGLRSGREIMSSLKEHGDGHEYPTSMNAAFGRQPKQFFNRRTMTSTLYSLVGTVVTRPIANIPANLMLRCRPNGIEVCKPPEPTTTPTPTSSTTESTASSTESTASSTESSSSSTESTLSSTQSTTTTTAESPPLKSVHIKAESESAVDQANSFIDFIFSSIPMVAEL